MRWCRPCLFSGVGSIGAEGDRDGLGDVVGLQPGLLGELKNVAELCRHCHAPMALAHQATTQKIHPRMIAAIGPSGAGKTTIARELLRRRSDLGYSVSCTTRKPRVGEVDGKDYYFLSRAEFERRRELEKSHAEREKYWADQEKDWRERDSLRGAAVKSPPEDRAF